MLADFIFHHIGIATPSIKETAGLYIDAGYSMSEIIFDSIQDVNISFLSKDNMPTIELLEPINETSPVLNIIKNSGVTPYHICYAVKDIEDAIKRLKQLKYIPLSSPVNAIAMYNRNICFLFNKDVGLIELVERL